MCYVERCDHETFLGSSINHLSIHRAVTAGFALKIIDFLLIIQINKICVVVVVLISAKKTLF